MRRNSSTGRESLSRATKPAEPMSREMLSMNNTTTTPAIAATTLASPTTATSTATDTTNATPEKSTPDIQSDGEVDRIPSPVRTITFAEPKDKVKKKGFFAKGKNVFKKLKKKKE